MAALAAGATVVALVAAPPARAQDGGADEVLVVAGDLDADRRPDVVGVAVAGDEVRFTGRRSTDGEQVWTTTVPGQGGGALPARIGADSRGGALLATTTSTQGPPPRATLRLVAIGPDGETVWTRTDEGTELATPVGGVQVGGPTLAGVVPAADGGTQILVALVDRNPLPLPVGAAAATTRIAVLDGSSGEQDALVEHVSTVPARVLALPDLDGGGTGDVLAVEASEAEAVAAAYSGEDGRLLWRAAGLPGDAADAVVVVGDATGDGIADLAAGSVGGERGATVLIDGGDGEVAWSRAAGVPVAVGNVAGDERAEVAVVTSTATPFAAEVHTLIVDGDGDDVRARRVDAGPAGASVTVADGGDLDGDGAADIVVGVTPAAPWQRLRTTLALDGGTGGPLWSALPGVPTRRGPGGPVLLDLAARPGGPQVSAVDGAGRVLWRAALRPAPGGVPAAIAPIPAGSGLRARADALVAVEVPGGAGAPPDSPGVGEQPPTRCSALLEAGDGNISWDLPRGCATAGLPHEPLVERSAGEDRIRTALELSAATWSTSEVVVLARADAYADALAGAPLAARLDAPLLLTERSALSRPVRNELARLEATTVVVLGGEAAVAPPVVDELRALGLAVARVSGPTRAATAAAVSMLAGVPGGDVMVVAGGDVADASSSGDAPGWPDALAAGPLAAATGATLLLTERDRVPEETVVALRTLQPRAVTIVGGRAVVGDVVVELLDAEGPRPRRLAGADRYETAALLDEAAAGVGVQPVVTWIATGRDWPDGLAAGAGAGSAGARLLLVDGQDLSDSPATAARLRESAAAVRIVRLVGGPAALAPAVERRVTTIVTATD